MRVVTGRELAVLLGEVAQGHTEIEIWHQDTRKDVTIIGDVVPGVAAMSVSPSVDFCEDSENFGKANFTLKFYGLEGGTVEPDTIFVVEVYGEIRVGDDTNYQLHVEKFGATSVEQVEDSHAAPSWVQRNEYVGFSRLPANPLWIVTLDRGRRDFLSSKWVDSVFNVLEAKDSPFDTERYIEEQYASMTESFEDDVWQANLSRRHAMDPINARLDRGGLLRSVERYMIAVDQDWTDRFWRSFDLYIGKASLSVVAMYLQEIKSLLDSDQILCSYASAQAEALVRDFYERTQKQLIASVQKANASKQVAAQINQAAPAVEKKSKVAVDPSKIAPMRSIDITFLSEGQQVVLKIEDELESRYVVAQVISNDEDAVDFREVDGDERTYTAYYSDQKHGTPEFAMGNMRLTLMTEVKGG